ncbi:hypothetical protein PC116_g30908 [Phytophthora cactorum]|nr:hypothetical protein PC116_g30908 [Phytophthora cactorum]
MSSSFEKSVKGATKIKVSLLVHAPIHGSSSLTPDDILE